VRFCTVHPCILAPPPPFLKEKRKRNPIHGKYAIGCELLLHLLCILFFLLCLNPPLVSIYCICALSFSPPMCTFAIPIVICPCLNGNLNALASVSFKGLYHQTKIVHLPDPPPNLHPFENKLSPICTKLDKQKNLSCHQTLRVCSLINFRRCLQRREKPPAIPKLLVFKQWLLEG